MGAAPPARGGRLERQLPHLRAPERGDRPLALGPARPRLPGAGRGQRRDPLAVRDGGAEGALAAAARGRRGPLVLLHDGARRVRIGPDRAADARGAGRRRVGHRRAQVVLVGRRGCRVRDRDGRHRPRRRAAPPRDPDHRPGRDARCRGRPRDSDHGPPRARLDDALRGALHGCTRPGREHARRGGGRVPHRAEAPRAGTHPPRHALARPDAARVRADVLVRARAGGLRRAARREADRAELDRRLRGRDPGLPAADPRRRAQDRRRATRRGSRSR